MSFEGFITLYYTSIVLFQASSVQVFCEFRATSPFMVTTVLPSVTTAECSVTFKASCTTLKSLESLKFIQNLKDVVVAVEVEKKFLFTETLMKEETDPCLG